MTVHVFILYKQENYGFSKIQKTVTIFLKPFTVVNNLISEKGMLESDDIIIGLSDQIDSHRQGLYTL